MIRFKTETGSTYEADRARRLIRRLGNAEGREPTERQGADGIWKSYADLDLMLWQRALITWRYDETGLGRIARTTLTSVVTEIEGFAEAVA